MALVKNNAVVPNDFTRLADADAIPETGSIFVSAKRFLEHRDALLARKAPVGVWLEAADSPEPLGDNVHKLAAVAVNFPGPRDGRAFTWARILRTRMGYKGEVRAVGHYIRDHVAFLTRVGVDAFDLPEHLTKADYDSSLHDFSHVYQRAADGQKTIWDLRLGK